MTAVSYTHLDVYKRQPQVRAANFEEVCLGYNAEEAMAEAARCLNCKNAQCMNCLLYTSDLEQTIEKFRLMEI